jgi:bifunctional DNA-binding transcriptional regulator/antitoxin component of YhaV-PrlF toxin-antitoxin module
MLQSMKAASSMPAVMAWLRADPARATQYVAVQSRGTIALPAGLRRRLHLDEPGAQVAITERADGVIELRSALPVAADQRWFWTERWQAMEREMDEHVAAGRVSTHDGVDALFEQLDRDAGVTTQPTEPTEPSGPDEPAGPGDHDAR